ncbi:MAG: hypothetical protein ABSF43_13500 [Rectinemataceae bacterium]|jgi:hypothetical protein
MGAKKKYPEPFRRPDSPDSKVYYFMLEGQDGKRHRMSTGETSKELAREFIRSYLDDMRSGATALTFLFCAGAGALISGRSAGPLST